MPFISWIRDFGDGPRAQSDMFYTVRSEQDLLFAEEIKSASQRHEQFRSHFRVSSEQGYLTVDQIAALGCPRQCFYANGVGSKNRSSTFRVMRETLLS